jgi:hypothetical protein
LTVQQDEEIILILGGKKYHWVLGGGGLDEPACAVMGLKFVIIELLLFYV